MEIGSWAQAARYLNSVMSWSGDLGVESLPWTLVGRISDIFGDRTIAEDRATLGLEGFGATATAAARGSSSSFPHQRRGRRRLGA
eukprot:8715360-Alexandrium_andersonii.AAC.1